MIAMIAAMGRNRAIGRKNTLPWQLPADLAHFKALTMGKPIVMGRKTFESIGRPLPKRRNVVVTRQQDWSMPGCEVYLSLEEALGAVSEEPEVMVIGGGSIYGQALPLADRLYLTFVDVEVPDADAFFPEWDETQWRELESASHAPDDKNAHAYQFVMLERLNRVVSRAE